MAACPDAALPDEQPYASGYGPICRSGSSTSSGYGIASSWAMATAPSACARPRPRYPHQSG